MSSELDAPITPCVISGAYEAWPRSRRWPRPGRISVRFGPPIDPESLTRAAGSASEGHAAVSLALRRALVELGAPEP